jgi:hypothetical protein
LWLDVGHYFFCLRFFGTTPKRLYTCAYSELIIAKSSFDCLKLCDYISQTGIDDLSQYLRTGTDSEFRACSGHLQVKVASFVTVRTSFVVVY